MRKKILPLTLICLGVVLVVFALYCLREVSPVKEFITWAISIWPIIAVVGGFGVIASGWFIKHDSSHHKDKEPQASLKINLGLDDIIPTLKTMDEKLIDLAHREAKKWFFPIRSLLLVDEINKFLGITPEKLQNPYDYEEAKLATSKIESDMVKNFEEINSNPQVIKDYLTKVKNLSTFWDSKNYGLKKVRNQDKQYRQYKSDVDILKNTQADKELGEMIEDHIEFSEAFANNILAKERALKMGAFVNRRIYNFNSFASFETQVKVEKIEDDMAKFLSEIRDCIGERIKELKPKIKSN